MPTKLPPIVFLGSGPVAARSLELLAGDFEIEAVITKPKPEHHRGSFPVLEVAKKLDLRVYPVTNKAELSMLIAQQPFKSRLALLIDFGIIVSQDTIDYFPLGIINSHFSILPQWRGADPITFAILSGQKMTGVSLMLLVKAMDEGPLIGYAEQPLTGRETAPELTEQLIHLSHRLLLRDLPGYIAGQTKTVSQATTGQKVSYSRKLTKADGSIDWHKPAEELEREIRAFLPWPKSRATLAGQDVIITKARVEPDAKAALGNVTVTESKEITVATGKDDLVIERLKPAGRSEMSSAAFVAGLGGRTAL